VSPEVTVYSDYIKDVVWSGVEDALRGIYNEASDVLGRELPSPKKEK